jgi:RNase P/RNase MRP subunit p29
VKLSTTDIAYGRISDYQRKEIPIEVYEQVLKFEKDSDLLWATFTVETDNWAIFKVQGRILITKIYDQTYL